MYFIKPSLRNKIVKRDNCKCAYCGKYVPKKQRSLDHVVPQSKGGHDKPYNLVLSCMKCNMAKGNKSLPEYLQYLILEGFIDSRQVKFIEQRIFSRINCPVT